MKKIKILIDFGSTYTKVVAVDLDKVEVVATARVPSTVESDITIGLQQALEQIGNRVAIGPAEIKNALACSSAAGGLRMVCIGFVPDLTSKAAHLAALGAGAKIVGLYSYKITRSELEEIEKTRPDIVLLSGGTVGGDDQVILHNAKMLSMAGRSISNIIVAGNKTTYDAIGSLFANDSKRVTFTSNVMPEIGTLDVEPCNREIRDLFLSRIIYAKGIDRAQTIIQGVIMPTPAAVLNSARLLAEGYADMAGLGELMVIDPGGATTDVHSIAKGIPSKNGVTLSNSLPEPYIKRTVEGNLGLKYNIDTLKKLAENIEKFPGINQLVGKFYQGSLPESEEEKACHVFLSRLAVETATNQHAGRLEVIYSPMGEMWIQHGKDLTQVKTVIGTGGPIINSPDPRKVLEGTQFQEERPRILKPVKPRFLLDKEYILFAVGLLCLSEPRNALNLARKYLVPV